MSPHTVTISRWLNRSGVVTLLSRSEAAYILRTMQPVLITRASGERVWRTIHGSRLEIVAVSK